MNNGTILHTWNLLTGCILSVLTTLKKKSGEEDGKYVQWFILISLIAVIILWCECLPNYRVVYLKYTNFYLSITCNKAGKRKENSTQKISQQNPTVYSENSIS